MVVRWPVGDCPHEVHVFEDGVFLRENFGDDVDLAVRIKALGQVQQRRVGSGSALISAPVLIPGTCVLRVRRLACCAAADLAVSLLPDR